MDGIHLDGMPLRLPPASPSLPTLSTHLLPRAFHNDAHDQHRQNGFIITCSVVTALAVVFVAMRTVSRFCIIRKPGVDDYLLVVSIFLTVGWLACLAVAVANHVGFPTIYLSAANIRAVTKDALAMQVIYYVNICLIKSSIVFTYLRFAVTSLFRRLCWGTIAFHCLLCIACVVTVFLQTSPLSHMWNPDGTLELNINLQAFFYATAGINIVTDFWILLLPVHALLKVRRPRREKIALFCIFGAGLFGSIASIVRLYTIHQYFATEDQLLHCLALDMWGTIEMCVGTCCASLTGIRPILSSTRRFGSSLRSSDDSEKERRNKNAERGVRAQKQRRKSDFVFSQNRRKRSPQDLEAALYGTVGTQATTRSQETYDTGVAGFEDNSTSQSSHITRPAPVASSGSTSPSGSLKEYAGQQNTQAERAIDY